MSFYCRSTILEFIEELTIKRDHKQIKTSKWKINRKTALVLIEVAKTGRFEWKLSRRIQLRCHYNQIEEIRKDYCGILEDKNLAKSTIELHDYVFRTALDIATIRIVKELSSCSPIYVQSMIKGFSRGCNQRSISKILPILRHILEYYFKNGLIEANLAGMVMSAHVSRGHLSSYIAISDEDKLVSQLEQSSLRIKAIMLLSLRLGLRDCDIGNLTFQEIDWKKDCIRLIQKKTGKPLILPLLPDVGNTLMDYILYERPSRNDGYPYIFLREQAPFNHLVPLLLIGCFHPKCPIR